ncbi:hypothetical protein A8V01_13145 [Novosphingobium guangzhouense]|uniref:Uncharacterized protein n=1 Tax=Novosphingobium guangzhouense TaxID=1850347 RepID=A0A2K2G4P4_9SPHN|nr:hypothetical protein A8V01_13145 [Novosphingobium guangzhouense]
MIDAVRLAALAVIAGTNGAATRIGTGIRPRATTAAITRIGVLVEMTGSIEAATDGPIVVVRMARPVLSWAHWAAQLSRS